MRMLLHMACRKAPTHHRPAPLTPPHTHSLLRLPVSPLQKGKVLLTELNVTDSSEALLSGRKPPFRLCVRAVHADGRRLHIRHAVSEGFVVSRGSAGRGSAGG